MIRSDGGQVIAQERAGRTPGAKMTVERLFARAPTRLKFLKSTNAERSHIERRRSALRDGLSTHSLQLSP
ncbi:MAG: hypothetical protein J7601_10900 [Chloroflexi bacterium]|nr:hypothetical protein [Chloroflexota bacterium]